ncbi:MAG TPA: DUF2950 domain-containing protein [Methylomirabilota bacterium]
MTARSRALVLVIATALALPGGVANAQAPGLTRPETPPAAKPPAATAPKPAVVKPRGFASAEQATQALVTALRAGDVKALVGILGSDGRSLIVSGDPVVDRQSRERFLGAYDAVNKLVADGRATVLHVGHDEWPFPIPLVKQGDRWQFDVRRGRDEIIARRLGRNELYTIQTCLAYVDAQREYYTDDRNGDGVLEYAQHFASTPGRRDGLYWFTRPGEPSSPLGELVVRARAEGYRRGEGSGPTPFHGYLYRGLTAQGPDAPGGAYDYLTRSHMIGGFALVAFPAQYGVSGVMTFMVNHDGVVYQKDLGPNTRATALAMRAYNPDHTWARLDVADTAATGH